MSGSSGAHINDVIFNLNISIELNSARAFVVLDDFGLSFRCIPEQTCRCYIHPEYNVLVPVHTSINTLISIGYT